MFERMTVDSGLISQIGYDNETSTLLVAFHDKKNNVQKPYTYPDFPRAEFDAFAIADVDGEKSYGKYWLRRLKARLTTFTRLPDEPAPAMEAKSDPLEGTNGIAVAREKGTTEGTATIARHPEKQTSPDKGTDRRGTRGSARGTRPVRK